MPVDTKGQSVEAEDIIDQVRRQLRRELLLPMRNSPVRLYAGAVRIWRSGAPKADAPRISKDSEEMAERLQAMYTSLDSGFAAGTAGIGEMPPVTRTLRGTAGRVVIGALQRLMWWYTRSLQRFAEAVGAHLQDSTEAIENLACLQEANRIEIAALREEVRRLRERLAAEPGDDQ